MRSIVVVYHSGYGHTEVLAKEVVAGAGEGAVLVKLESGQTDFEEVFTQIAHADAVIFGSPTYMGTVTAPFKAFMDASSKPWSQLAWKDKLGAGFTNSGSLSGDKLNTLTTMVVFAMQHGMVWIGTGTLPGNPNGNSDTGSAVENRLGSSTGAMAQSDNAAPDVTPPAGDRATARALGARVAAAARRWTASAA